MPKVKNAQLRYRIIDKSIRNPHKPFPTKDKLRRACEEELYGSSHGEHISDSTIEKDLFAMREEFDAPIAYSKRERGYYYTDDNFTMDDIPLNEEDVEAIRFAAKIFHQFRNVDVFQQFGFAIDKILDRVEISDKFNDKAVNDYVHFETRPEVGGSEHLNPILKAIKKRKSVQFEYQKFNSTESKIRRIDPYLLKEYRNRWYLIGKSIAKNKTITFALDRIKELSVLSESFVADTNFNPEVFFKHSIGITSFEGNPEIVRFQANKFLSQYLLSQPIHPTQKLIKEKKKSMVFEVEVLITPELIMLLLSHGGNLKVLGPEILKTQLKQELETSLLNY